MSEKSRSESIIKRMIHRISKHSPIFYVIVIFLLIVFQLDIFKDNVPKEYIINGIIVISMFALATNAVDKAIRKMIKGKFDCVTTSLLQTFPKGIGVEILSFDTLEKTWKNSTIPYERETVTPYIYNNSNKFKIFNLVNSKNLSDINLIIQRKSDLKLVRNIISKIKKRPILMKDVLRVLNK